MTHRLLAPHGQRRRPEGPSTAGTSANNASNIVASLTLAAVTATASGRPWPSVTRWSLEPGLPRSTGFAPTRSPPPALGPHADRVHVRPRPVQPARQPQPVQHLDVEGVEHSGLGPLIQPPPDRRRRAAAKLTGGSSRHGTDVRTMYTIAAKQLRSGTVRRRPPYQERGGVGSSGSTSCRSSSGTRESTRVIADDHAS
jgi:hypothetical protein